MKRTKLFLTESEVVYLQEIIPNTIIDLIEDGDDSCCSLNKKQLKALLKKVEDL